VPEQPLEDLLTRLDRERREADRRYNDALTVLDRAVQPAPRLPPAPSSVDTSRLSDLNQSWNILPGGSPDIDRSFKGRLRGLIWRLVGPPLEAQRQFNALAVEHLNRNARVHDDVSKVLAALIEACRQELDGLAAFESLLVQYLQTVTAYVDTKDGMIGGAELRQRLALAEQRILSLKREAEQVQQTSVVATTHTDAGGSAPIFSGNLDSSTYVGFEDRFRGGQPEIRRRVEDYVSILKGKSDVLDIGCGRGELLAALQQAGVKARGVDTNAAMVDICREQGLTADRGDALSYLEQQADGSIGGLTAIQVVEHFEPAYLARFLETAFHKMRPEAPIVLETINPACWMAFFETYIRDLTHQRPLHPDTLKYLVQASGFSGVDVQFRQPVGEGDRLDRVTIVGDAGTTLSRNVAEIADALNAHADKLNARLFSSADYVVIARR
jgi:2-polyprenyl-3-methyl-5-hydroxy-6-metoxy-1,4-benzoquinol methylase